MSRVMIIVMLAVLGACSNPQPDLKSPCVGSDGSPCVRRPVNAGVMEFRDWGLGIGENVVS